MRKARPVKDVKGQMVVHFAFQDNIRTLCGRLKKPDNAASKFSKVTCGNCLKEYLPVKVVKENWA